MNQYVYILINPSLDGLLKIGRTNRSPGERAKELSASTNMPTPFVVAYEDLVSDSDLAERLIHSELEELGYRINDNREFFSAPLKDAIRIVSSVAGKLRDVSVETSMTEVVSSVDSEESGEYYYQKGLASFFGTDEQFQDFGNAKICLEFALRLGVDKACIPLAHLYIDGKGVRQSLDSAIKLLMSGTAKGLLECYILMWKIYSGRTSLSVKNERNAELCIRKLINHEWNGLRFLEILSLLNEYVEESKYDADYNRLERDFDSKDSLFVAAISRVAEFARLGYNLVRMAREAGQSWEDMSHIFLQNGGNIIDLLLVNDRFVAFGAVGESLIRHAMQDLDIEDLEYLFSRAEDVQK